MFRSRRRYGGGYGRGGGMGILLLGMQLYQLFNFISRSNDYFPVTLGVLALNIAAYLQPGVIAWPSLQQACISVQGVWFQKQWKRVLFSPFFHSSESHLCYNMASFIWKAISLEKHFGTPYFLYMISVFSMGTGALYLGINYMLAEILDQWSYVQSCAVGFSGVIFALKVVTTHMQPGGVSMVMGILPVPTRLACWIELILISALFPNVSFVGHLAGILVGLAFVSGPLKTLMDIPLSLVAGYPGTGGAQTGGRRAYTYRADYSGRTSRPDDRTPRRPDGPESSDTEERELQAAIRRSMEEQETTPTRSNSTPSTNNSESSELQEAIERSMTDSDNHPPDRLPPYNPHYHSSDVRTDPAMSSDTVRRRPVVPAQDRDNMDAVRSARLRRFGTNS